MLSFLNVRRPEVDNKLGRYSRYRYTQLNIYIYLQFIYAYCFLSLLTDTEYRKFTPICNSQSKLKKKIILSPDDWSFTGMLLLNMIIELWTEFNVLHWTFLTAFS